jgi:hypothetical protein
LKRIAADLSVQNRSCEGRKDLSALQGEQECKVSEIVVSDVFDRLLFAGLSVKVGSPVDHARSGRRPLRRRRKDEESQITGR